MTGDDLFARLCSNSKLERDRAEAELEQAVAEREVVVVEAVSATATALLAGKQTSSVESSRNITELPYYFSPRAELGTEAGLPEG